ncbi:hypothetical protein [Streptomyces yangpuensis]|uniref:hypothetical protein n=1 Tax=Streptomyces yangpuensis TaxID=1648182 RepID=UPI00364A14BF
MTTPPRLPIRREVIAPQSLRRSMPAFPRPPIPQQVFLEPEYRQMLVSAPATDAPAGILDVDELDQDTDSGLE